MSNARLLAIVVTSLGVLASLVAFVLVVARVASDQIAIYGPTWVGVGSAVGVLVCVVGLLVALAGLEY